MKKIFLAILLFSKLSIAATPATADFFEIFSDDYESSGRTSDYEYGVHKNFFHFGPAYLNRGLGFTLGYSRFITSQLTLGVIVGVSRFSSERIGIDWGNSSEPKNYSNNKSSSVELSATYYLRESGYGKWGPFVRASIGYGEFEAFASETYYKAVGFWDYEWAGENNDRQKWGSVISRLGAFHQFAWNFGEGAKVGHILEMGAGVNYIAQTNEVSYLKQNGAISRQQIENFTPFAEINYVLAF